MMYLGIVVRVDGSELYIRVPEIGGQFQFGPLQAVSFWYKDKYQTDTSLGNGAFVETDRETFYKKGDTVLVGQLGHIKEDLVVIGRIG